MRRGSEDVAGNSRTWAERLRAVPLSGSVALLIRDEGQVPPIGAQVSFIFEEGNLVGLRTDPKGEWQVARQERVNLGGIVGVAVQITRVIVRGGPEALRE